MKIKNHAIFNSFFLTRSLFLIVGYSLILNTSGSDSWISVICGTIIGTILIIIYQHFKSNNLINRVIIALYSIFMILTTLFILQTFTSNFYLIKTPNLVINIPFIFLVYYINKYKYSSIYRLGQLFFVISIIISIIVFIALFFYSDFSNITPVLSTPIHKVLLSSLYFAFMSAIPNILIYEIEDTNKDIVKSYLLTCLTLLITIFLAITILGNKLSIIYRAPEYMILKRVKIFNFIENIENIVSIIFIFDIFITSALATNVLKAKLPNKNNKLLLGGILISCLLVVSLSTINKNIYGLLIYQYLPIILIIFYILSLFTKYKK
ncbi:MAG: GerAB/ArcD/ProY family transporter [Bacilli bacterium]|nr:GerAB/ArcD/ProY family transporter [Bacilli bacterium]